MTEMKKPVRSDRRKFLKDLAVAGGATAAVVATGGAHAAEVAAEEPVEAKTEAGYQVTPHVETYYEKARF